MPTIDPTIAAWQSENREIGMLEFLPTDSAPERFSYWPLPSNAAFLGKVESDALCLMDDGTLCVYDHGVADRILCPAAPNQPNLIAAMTAMDDFFKRCDGDDKLADDESATIEIREKCTDTVGGADYASFIQLFFWA